VSKRPIVKRRSRTAVTEFPDRDAELPRLVARLPCMPAPEHTRIPIGNTSSIASLRLNGAALACFVQSGLKAICVDVT
jgi:hypothetical protein